MSFSSFLIGKLPGQTGSASVANSANILVMPCDDILLMSMKLHVVTLYLPYPSVDGEGRSRRYAHERGYLSLKMARCEPKNVEEM